MSWPGPTSAGPWRLRLRSRVLRQVDTPPSIAIGRPTTARNQPSACPERLAPAKARCDVLENALDDVGVVVDTQLVGDGQQQRIGFGDRLVPPQLLDQLVGFGRIAAAEDGALFRFDIA